MAHSLDGKEQSPEGSGLSQNETGDCVTGEAQVDAMESKSESDMSPFQEEVELSKNRADEILDEIAALLEEEEDVFPSFQFSDEKESKQIRHKKVKKYI
jgi:hypothetical protein